MNKKKGLNIPPKPIKTKPTQLGKVWGRNDPSSFAANWEETDIESKFIARPLSDFKFDD